MKLFSLLKDVPYKTNIKDIDVENVTCDTRSITDQSVFVCIKFQRFDGHVYAEKALQLGAKAVIVNYDVGLDNQIIVENTRDAYAAICSGLNGFPSEKLKLVAVTGTNGKTTVSHMIDHILNYNHNKTGLIGTIKNRIGDQEFEAVHTTPEPDELHKLLKYMVDSGCEYAVMEASSQALDQRRLSGCKFDTAVFTNLSTEHLDYHKTMENYFNAKKTLFSMCKTAVINIDDNYGCELLNLISCPAITCSLNKNNADLVAKNITFSNQGVSFVLLYGNNIGRVKLPMLGEYSVQNALLAAASCISLGISFDLVIKGLNTCEGINGRAELLKTNTEYSVIIDFAHTPEALKNILTAISKLHYKRVITLFGCGGERDRTKRKLMGEVASKLSDYVIVTSDNPRSENPTDIITDIIQGIDPKTRHIVIEDRYEAIRWALLNAREGDAILLAGKGHENYQILKDNIIPFDEHQIVMELLSQI